MPEKSVILIGMPGVGKSTVGVLLAKRLARPFIDTDLMVQASMGQTLSQIIQERGMDAFCELEGGQVAHLALDGEVVATGGSIVYSEAAMGHLASAGIIVHLWLPLEPLRQRLGDLRQRGVVLPAGESLEQLYERRMPLYRRWAQVTIDCCDLDHEGVVNAMMGRLKTL